MIISASYRTDIPAFYGEWFERRSRLDTAPSPIRTTAARSASASRPEDVDGRLWTRNLGPFMGRLTRVADLGRPFVVQQTVTGYPRSLEPAARRRRRGGPAGPGPSPRPTGRRPPSGGTTRSSLADAAGVPPRELREARRGAGGATDEVVTPAQVYRKAVRNLDQAARNFSFTWTDPARRCQVGPRQNPWRWRKLTA